ncbi:D-3-phosphoglycerate dehydrogenase/(S)-sulfolactate dehydrogenase [Prauserella shujinwangii]|uniref:D-3-phosphoglycerate dehydrogenase/(S)-sulfolactate dehydrogenase n=1 Tax=Prauserella shujinwangii TaxID=1453103 RepID=A0A2T0LT55_9PSEU|nr:phosphoglycerate dehydrogenase [Prauserella shujinwangii]PRX46928.1 D-3-phosphoglycerate dehydrogenase/(S)-sulfolactate dehydrogenase [Prauserella shujinwangii]
MPRVLITTDYLRPGDDVDRFLRGSGLDTVHLPMVGRRDPGQLVAALAGIDAALVANEPLTADVLARAPRLRAVVRTGVGYDSIDVAAAARLGITVSNLPGINANAVAEYTLGLLLAGARRLVQSAHGVARGGWPREDGHELRGATLGLIGYGAAARAVVPLARAFGMTVVCATNVPAPLRGDQDVRFVELPELLAVSDYVSVHTALTDRTRGLLDESAFRRMKPTALLVNTARGPIVDEDALAAAVRSGEIAGAALDVVSAEPLPPGSPLRDVDGIVVYSHLAGQTAEARAAAGRAGAEELVAALEGRARFVVNAALITEGKK